MKIAFCGGHVTPAIACIDYIRLNYPDHSLYLIGRVYAQKQGGQLAHEKDLALSRRVQFVPFEGVRWDNDNWRKVIFTSLRLIWASVKALIIIFSLKPSVLVCFGGYLAVPLAISAWILRIPVITHEQTHTSGKANKLIGIIATKIAISHASSSEYFPKKKTVLTGNLLRQEMFVARPNPPAWIKKVPSGRLVYITGGSQGSQVINSVVKKSLSLLLKDCWIIHQCGKNTSSQSYYTELTTASDQLGPKKNRYQVREWVTESELAWILRHAHLAVSRAGANTVDELVATRVPSILIPLPFTHDEEQLANAKAIVDLGGAILLEQKNLSQQTLIKAIGDLMPAADTMRSNLSKIEVINDAPARFYQIIASVTS